MEQFGKLNNQKVVISDIAIKANLSKFQRWFSCLSGFVYVAKPPAQILFSKVSKIFGKSLLLSNGKTIFDFESVECTLQAANGIMLTNFFIQDYILLLENFRDNTEYEHYSKILYCPPMSKMQNPTISRNEILHSMQKYFTEDRANEWQHLEVLVLICSSPMEEEKNSVEPIGHFWLFAIFFDKLSRKDSDLPFLIKCDSINKKSTPTIEETKIIFFAINEVNSKMGKNSKQIDQLMRKYLDIREIQPFDDVLRVEFLHLQQSALDCGFLSLMMAVCLTSEKVISTLCNPTSIKNTGISNFLQVISSARNTDKAYKLVIILQFFI